jgi:SCY1-like protein 2
MATMQSVSRPSRLGAKPIPTASFDSSSFTSPVMQSSRSDSSGFTSPIMQSSRPDRILTPPLQPQRPTSYMIPPPPSSPPKPNYNFSFSDITATTPSTITPTPRYIPSSYTPLQPTSSAFSMSSPPLHASPLSMGSMLVPLQPARPTTATRPISKDDWGDFDPLK